MVKQESSGDGSKTDALLEHRGVASPGVRAQI